MEKIVEDTVGDLPVQKPRKKKHHGGLIALIVVILIIAAGAAGYCVYADQYTDKFIEGTFINGENVGNLTAAQVESSIKKRVENYELTVDFGNGQTEKLTNEDVGLTYTPDGNVEKILQEQNKYAWIEGKLLGKKQNYTVGESYSFDSDKVKNALNGFPEMQTEKQTAPQNAYMTRNDDGTFTIVPEAEGNTIVPDVVYKAVDNAVKRGKRKVDVTKLKGVYEKPTVLSDDKDLNAQVDDLNNFLSTTVTYKKYNGDTVTLDKNTTKDWLSVSDDDSNYYYINTDVIRSKCADFIKQFAASDDEVKDTTTFHSQNKGDIQLPCKKYGHTIDQSAETEALYQDLINKKSETRTPTYSMNTQNGGFGDVFVEIDLDAQHVYVHKGDTIAFDCDCVSGLATDPSRATPKGVFKIFWKTTNRDLKGNYGPDGQPGYVSHVNFWMPFNGGVGMHDASWRSQFGGQIYKTSGSHGCVNLSYDSAKAIYDLVSVGTYVIVI